ncbi:MAG: chromosomal replication initiator protein DnaA [Sedimentisphaerales bacterium]|nr:chromosomal replication initiator protein DnaA [Sedimentisphaerales bacterium]
MGDVLSEIWDKTLRYFQKRKSDLWRSWFEQLEPISLENGLLRIGVPEQTWMRYLQQMCNEGLKEAAQQITGHLLSLEYYHTDHNQLSDQRYANEPAETIEDGELFCFSPDYTFDHFVVGPSNRLAHAACTAVSESPGQAYNPLFIHGSVGLGKTHLLQAACQVLLKHRPPLRVSYLSCETFINHFIRAVEQGKLHEFRYKYRHADMLVIDDVQFLSDQEQTQEEFFHTFNTLYQTRKQIVLSADCSPAEIPKLEQRLVSRFNQGLVARIDRPDFETRMAIIHKKAQLRGIDPPEEVVTLIARKIESNTRELEGALTKVHGLAMLENGLITLELAREALGEEPISAHHQVTISKIIEAVTKHFDVRLSDLQGKRRSRSIAFPRQVCMYLARDLTNHSLEEIGGHFGGRDHTTVLHAYRTIDKLCDHDVHVRSTVANLVSSLTQA